MCGRQFFHLENNVELADKIKASLVFFCYRLLNYLLKILAYLLWPKTVKGIPQKVCIYRIGNIGDIICAIPAFINIRQTYPEAQITLLTSPGERGMPGAKELVENAWFVNRLWVYHSDELKSLSNIYQFVKKLRSESFDLLIILPQELISPKTLIRNLFFIRLCRVKKTIGFEISTIKFWPRAQSTFRQFDNEVERLVKLLKNWGLPISDKIKYDLPLPEEVKKSASEILEEYQIKTGLVFGFVPGAKRIANQWSPDNFAKLGSFILRQYPNSKIIIFGGKEDSDNGEYIKGKIGSNSVINLCGLTSLLEAAFILNGLRLLITNNTGLMHMAALSGIKVLAIFSSAELNGKWFPYGKNSCVFTKRIDCEGCYYRECPNDYQCIKNTNPEEIKKEIAKIVLE